MDNDPLFSTSQASQYVGMARQTLARLRVEGSGPAYFKLGSKVAYRQSTLDAWLSERLRRSTSEGRGARDRRTSTE
jgi:predicted DNA-binding transcriptional regulator AlpA